MNYKPFLLMSALLAYGSSAFAGSPFDPLTGNGFVPPAVLTRAYLLGSAPQTPILANYSAYALPMQAAEPTTQGTLRVLAGSSLDSQQFSVIKDDYNYSGSNPSIRRLPSFDVNFVTTGSHIFPVQRQSLNDGNSPLWDYVFAPGRFWLEKVTEAGKSYIQHRAAVPFGLHQKGSDCMHNGVMSFLWDGASISNIAYQISSETCSYFKFDAFGVMTAKLGDASGTQGKTSGTISNGNIGSNDYDNAVAIFKAEINNRMPTKPLAQLSSDFPGKNIDTSKIAAPGDGAGTVTGNISTVGFVVNGIHYRGDCVTRTGSYPYCESLLLPSYSTAKSIAAGIAMMRLNKLYPGASKNVKISNVVTQCTSDGKNDFSIDDAINMTTGRYNSNGFEVDEDSLAMTNGFFLPPTDLVKSTYACSLPIKEPPGASFNYHTSDTYLAGKAMQAFYKSQKGNTYKDIWRDMMVAGLWKPLKFSTSAWDTRRTTDTVAQPYFGYGLVFLPDDIAKLASFIGIERGKINGVQMLNQQDIDAALQRNPSDRGLTPPTSVWTDQFTKYKNGFWAYNLKSPYFGCWNDNYVPIMSGYSGVTVALMQNNTVFYDFNDEQTFYWLQAAIESNKISTLCIN